MYIILNDKAHGPGVNGIDMISLKFALDEKFLGTYFVHLAAKISDFLPHIKYHSITRDAFALGRELYTCTCSHSACKHREKDASIFEYLNHYIDELTESIHR